MKLNHLFVAALALGLAQSALFAQEVHGGGNPGGGGGNAETHRTYSKQAPGGGGGNAGGVPRPSPTTSVGITKISTRSTVTNSISRVTTARPATIRTAVLTRVNLRRPTTTTTTGGSSGSSSSGGGGNQLPP